MADTHSETGIVLCIQFHVCSLVRDVPREPNRHELVYYSCEVEFCCLFLAIHRWKVTT